MEATQREMGLFTSVFFSILLLSELGMTQQETRTVFLVRHAEAASTATDAALTPAGEKRADCLGKMLKEAGIKQIFVTEAQAHAANGCAPGTCSKAQANSCSRKRVQ